VESTVAEILTFGHMLAKMLKQRIAVNVSEVVISFYKVSNTLLQIYSEIIFENWSIFDEVMKLMKSGGLPFWSTVYISNICS